MMGTSIAEHAQASTHLALIDAALTLDAALDGSGSTGRPW
jgi:hypothetical protein